VPNVAAEKRFLWVRGIDQRRFVASMLSVPLSWNDQVVGVLNVQTEEHRVFSPADAAQLGAIGDLLAGIVEKGRQQAEAEARLAEMRRIDEARGELIALVTHELRTPLAVVRAYTELLAEDPPLEEGRESRDPARRAQRTAWHDASLAQVERLDRLVDSILQSVRVVPDVPAAVEPTDVEAAIREVVASIEPIVRQHNLDLQPGVGLHALADPPRLRQILEHLIENAVKYAPPETTITIDRQLVEGWVRIGVTDQGPGVPEEWRERIFEPYARRDTHTARGSGIGLYAAKRLGESMGARLWCEPVDPTGARFVVSLPAAAAV
jgi:signal transduction histidine kinase